MDLKKIQELIKLVKKSEIAELKVKEGDFSISIRNQGFEQPTYITSAPAQQTQVATTSAGESGKQQAVSAETPATTKPSDNQIIFRSPMVGTFYRKPGADKDPYVKVGDNIKAGDVLCIIEAMKLFNEIEFDGAAGKIVKILAEDASPVEYDQPLFLVERS